MVSKSIMHPFPILSVTQIIILVNAPRVETVATTDVHPPGQNVVYNLTLAINKILYEKYEHGAEKEENEKEGWREVVLSALTESPTYMYSAAPKVVDNFSMVVEEVSNLMKELYEENAPRMIKKPSMLLSISYECFRPLHNFRVDEDNVTRWVEMERLVVSGGGGPLAGILLDFNGAPTRCSSTEYTLMGFTLKNFQNWNADHRDYPLGVGYNARHIDCFELVKGISAMAATFVMITIKLVFNSGTYHSQSIFTKNVNEIAERNRKFVGEANRNIIKVIYNVELLLSVPPDTPKKISERQRHLILFHKMCRHWATRQGTVMVVHTLNNASLHLRLEAEKFPADIIIPAMERMVDNNNMGLLEPLNYSIALPSLLGQLGGMFSSVYVGKDMWSQILLHGGGSPHWNLTFYYPLEERLFLEARNKISSTLESSRPKAVALFSPLWSLFPPVVNAVRNTAIEAAKYFSIGCELGLGNLLTSEHIFIRSNYLDYHVKSRCAHVLHLASVILVWKYDLDLVDWSGKGYYSAFYPARVHNSLKVIAGQINQLEGIYPGKKVVIRFQLQSNNCSGSGGGMSSPSCCSPHCAALYELCEAILNWGYLTNVQVILSGVGDVGIWRVLRGSSDRLRVTATQFPHLLSRNFPSNLDGFYVWNTPDPCVPHHLPTTGTGTHTEPIIFDKRFTGASLNMSSVSANDDNPLGVLELRTLLRFAASKFSTLEIVLGRSRLDETTITLATAITQEVEEEGSWWEDNDFQLEVYLNIPGEVVMSSSSSSTFGELIGTLSSSLKSSESKIQLGGIHTIMTPVTITEGGLTLLTRRTSHLKFGLVLDNCEELVTSILRKSSHFHQKLVSPTLANISYLVCLTPPPDKYNKNASRTDNNYNHQWTSGQLEDHLYMASAMKTYNPNVALYCHHTSSTNEGMMSEEVVGVGPTTRALSVVNFTVEYAKTNKLFHFVVKLVGDNGWWRIRNDTDLTDVDGFIEREAEILNTSSWRPPKIRVATKNETSLAEFFMPTWAFSLVVGVGIIITLLSLALASQAIYIFLIRKRMRYLSQGEMSEFMDGNTGGGGGGGADCSDDLVSTLKYNETFEIPKLQLNLHEATILGMGFFGVVFKSVVKGGVAAIKMPNDQCSKQSFKSMMAEVKIMCYLGEHPNIVHFIGCHTSELGKGMIYIVTGYCQNGNLKDYLRKQQPPPPSSETAEGGNNTGSDPAKQFFEMTKFCYEIASGMKYISDKNVVHADLSARNVLLGECNTCKITDYGLSRRLYESSIYVKKEKEPMPWRWMSWESLKNMEFTVKSDVWSFGITMWEIFSLGGSPYPAHQFTDDFLDELKEGLRPKKPEFATPEIYSLMLDCWNIDSNARPAFEELQGFYLKLRSGDYDDIIVC